MTNHFSRRILLSTVISLIGGTVQADVTPQDVWSRFKTFATEQGVGFSGSEQKDGENLIVSNASFDFALPNDAGLINVLFEELRYRANGDGTVAYDFPTQKVIITVDAEDEDPIEIALQVTQENWQSIVSGDPDKMVFDTSADALRMKLIDFDAADIDGLENVDKFIFDMVMSGYSGKTEYNFAKGLSVSLSSSTDDVTTNLTLGDDGEQGEFIQKTTIEGLSSTAAIKFDADDSTGTLSLANIDSNYTTQNTTSEMSVVTPDEPGFSLKIVSSDQTQDLHLDPTMVTMKQSADSAKYVMESEEIPFPFEMSLGKQFGAFMLPLGKGNGPQDFSLKLDFEDVNLSDELWTIVDYNEVFPHDPASLSLDLSGQTTLFQGVYDMIAAGPIDLPLQVDNLALNELSLSLGGMDLAGQGALTVDNSDIADKTGLPVTEGDFTFKLNGAMQFIDQLIAAGFMPEQEALGIRGMLSIFGKPTGEDDQLQSDVRIQKTDN